MVQNRRHEGGHIRRGRADAADRPERNQLKLFLLVGLPLETVSLRHVAGLFGRQRLRQQGMFHDKRIEDVCLQVLFPWLPRNLLDHMHGQTCAVIGVRRVHARLAYARGHFFAQDLAKRTYLPRIVAEQPDHLVLEARRVCHEIFHGHRRAVGPRHFHVGQVRVHIGVEIELALFDHLHHRGPYEKLRNRADAKERRRGIDGLSGLEVRVAPALGEDNLAVAHDRHNSTRAMMCFEHRVHGAVHPGFKSCAIIERHGLCLGG